MSGNKAVKTGMVVLLLSLLASGMTGCGVKNDLMTPSGHQTPPNQNDPSKPPSPIGQ